MKQNERRPHEKRRGWLKNGNPPGDFSKAPRCKAKTRRGTPCQCPAMANRRCRLHGGLSTGPKTAQGIERIRRAVTKHGRYTQAAKQERQGLRSLEMDARALLSQIDQLESEVRRYVEQRSEAAEATGGREPEAEARGS